MLRNGILQDSFCMLSFLRLIGLRIDGSMLGFQWADGRYKIWGVILQAGHHPTVGFEIQNNPCGHLLIKNVP